MSNKHLNKIVEESLHSLDGCKRAEAPPFLYTRIVSRSAADSQPNLWVRLGAILSRPVVAISCILIVLAVNFMVVKSAPQPLLVNQQNDPGEELAFGLPSLIDLVTPEP
jgi:hypothetical protein